MSISNHFLVPLGWRSMNLVTTTTKELEGTFAFSSTLSPCGLDREAPMWYRGTESLLISSVISIVECMLINNIYYKE
jgi:hypothetical protein